ncbi:hypothetical protein ASD24_10525 [Paenibacillus sp. Root52]|uniref:hypothetical protein n=1 Tax=Paenibacillus TaxID=44249 RepID=UPI0006F33B8E|nr:MULTISPECIES: hypothetical protein [Paenibacillus]KQY84202.1 hypothetical protein ASD24_10525 [Paenibacillus sp. Root52]
MSIWKKQMIIYMEFIGFLVIGFIVTENVMRNIYERFNIPFMGNVWVNWFGVSYFLFFLYTLICALCIKKNADFFRKRFKSLIFWAFLIGSLYVIFVPFVKGENPF